MNERDALDRMIAPGTRRPGKFRGGVIQIHLTRACDLSCFACTQGSNLAGKPTFMTPVQFDMACTSLKGYWGVVGVFGGNPALSPHFEECCHILRRHFPKEQCGLWCNHPRGKGRVMRQTFNPAVSNLNVHLVREAWDEFKRDWPECRPFGLDRDSRHAPVHLAMRDVLRKPCPRCQAERQAGLEDNGGAVCPDCGGTWQVYDEDRAWSLIADCDINRHWSAMIGVFRGQVRAWFCEIAGAQAILHQDEPDYPDTGIPIPTDPRKLLAPGGPDDRTVDNRGVAGRPLFKHYGAWWQLPMSAFADQVRKHCHECSVPLRGYGELAQAQHGTEQTSATHAAVFRPKRKSRPVQQVTDLYQLGIGRLTKTTDYLGNAGR